MQSSPPGHIFHEVANVGGQFMSATLHFMTGDLTWTTFLTLLIVRFSHRRLPYSSTSDLHPCHIGLPAMTGPPRQQFQSRFDRKDSITILLIGLGLHRIN